MAVAGPIPTRKPTTKHISVRGLVFALDGRERAYPVYKFSHRTVHEKPKHNPFAGL